MPKIPQTSTFLVAEDFGAHCCRFLSSFPITIHPRLCPAPVATTLGSTVVSTCAVFLGFRIQNAGSIWMQSSILGNPYFLCQRSHKISFFKSFGMVSTIFLGISAAFHRPFIADKCGYFIQFAWHSAWFWQFSSKLSHSRCSSSPQLSFFVHYISLLTIGGSDHSSTSVIELQSSLEPVIRKFGAIKHRVSRSPLFTNSHRKPSVIWHGCLWLIY